MPPFEPQTAVGFTTVPIDTYLAEIPLSFEAGLLICPEDMQIELLGVHFRANILPVDAANDVKFDLEFIDDSGADAVTVLKAAYDMLAAGSTVLIGNEVWVGSQLMDPGDVINAEFDVTTPTTAAQGACLQVTYRVRKRSAG